MTRPRSLLVAAVAIFLGGCSDFLNKFTTDSTAPVLKIASRSMDAESDTTFAREAAPGSLKTVDGFLMASPENPDLLEIVSQGYTQYAFGFLEDDLEMLPEGDSPQRQALIDRATGIYDRAHQFALRLVKLSDENFPKALQADTATLEQALTNLKPPSAPGLFWAGLSMGSAINLHRDDMDRVADLPRAIALLERAHQLNADYFNHGAAMSLGVVYASQGKAVGGNPDKAKVYFDEVITATKGRYLMAQVLYARFYATVTQDRELFVKTLTTVLATPPSVWPEQRLANELAHRRAARYLKQVDDLF
ncbi:MAG: hypothetical protein EXR72_02115 [Myxococcales bacterium]|nr:hypothetical protein [Myxococcales bacterium]